MTKINGHDDSNITPFPTQKEREAIEKARFVHPQNDDRLPAEPIFNLPPVVRALCLINVAVFLFGFLFPNIMTDDMLYSLAFVPARYTEHLTFAAILSPLTHMFIHAGWAHLGINVGMLMAFGAAVEKKIGGRRLLLIYFISGLAGALVHALIYPGAEVPMIGASGAISGLFGAVIMLMYTEGMMGTGYRKLLPFVAVWIGVSIFFGVIGMPGTDNPIAWVTHIGGFIAGLLLYKPVSRLRVSQL